MYIIHSHHHVVRLSKLHNTTRLLSLKITVSGGNERSITQFSALVNPKIHKNSMKRALEKLNVAILKFDGLRLDGRVMAAQGRRAGAVPAHPADPVERLFARTLFSQMPGTVPSAQEPGACRAVGVEQHVPAAIADERGEHASVCPAMCTRCTESSPNRSYERLSGPMWFTRYQNRSGGSSIHSLREV